MNTTFIFRRVTFLVIAPYTLPYLRTDQFVVDNYLRRSLRALNKFLQLITDMTVLWNKTLTSKPGRGNFFFLLFWDKDTQTTAYDITKLPLH